MSVWHDRHTLIPDIEKTYTIIEEQDIRLILEPDPDYPALLREIPDPPYFLYVRGTLPDPHIPLLAVVGSRRFTSYGRQACESLVRDLSRAGIGIVSGLAFGIDKIAHETTLKENGYTMAILGSGIDDGGISPHAHQALGKTLLQTGALISEFPPGSPAAPKNFPLRNRIVAGMSLGTLVIEAAEKSGSLITARLALEYDRDVYAVPGSIFSSLAMGTNNLIKKGAVPVTHAQDILQTMAPAVQGATKETNPALGNLSPLEEAIVKLLSYESLHIDELAKRTSSSIAELSSTLMMLEIKKYTKHIGNQQYILIAK
jgi:DNA processing protein